MKNFVQEGKTVTVIAPSGGVSGGDLVVIGSIIGVAAFDAAEAAEVEVATEGVFTLPKASADDVSAGNLLYWDSAQGELTKTAGTGSKPLVGVATKAAGSGVTTVACKLGVHGITGPAT
jgi:predicted RecA/RadA family phage recombinase